MSNLLDKLNNRSNLIILGDINIDALQYGSNIRCTEYIDLLFSYGLLQFIMLPARSSDNFAMLIDHIITNVKTPVYEIDILTSRILDHFPVILKLTFTFKPKSTNKAITKRCFSNENKTKFLDALKNINWQIVGDAESAHILRFLNGTKRHFLLYLLILSFFSWNLKFSGNFIK